ncbi:FAD-dependent monooxygenase [Streptomyces scabiei]
MPVVIVGAGPTGLTAAALLGRHGLGVEASAPPALDRAHP